MEFRSEFAIMDITDGRGCVAEMIRSGGKLVVLVEVELDTIHSRDDGVSQEFSGRAKVRSGRVATREPGLSDPERRVILHALGLTPRGGKMRRWAHRNHYAAGVSDAPLWEGLVARGLAALIRDPCAVLPHHTYAVTTAGVEAVDMRFRVPRALTAGADRIRSAVQPG